MCAGRPRKQSRSSRSWQAASGDTRNGLGLRHAASQLFGLHLPLPATARLQDIQLAEVGHGHRSDFATAHLLVRRVYDRFGSKAEKRDLSIRCPLYPRKRTLSDATGMSALCQKRTFALQQIASLFDHLVDAGEQLRRHFEAERLGRMQVDGELELRRLQHRKLCRLSAVDDAAGISPDLTETVRKVCPVAR